MQATPGRPDRPDRADRYDRPRFRQDLVAETVDDAGGRFIDVMDPDRGNIFRFYEVEYSLACGMDGERDVAGIVKWAQDELGLTPSQLEVRTVIATLGDLGFIDAGDAAAEPAPELAPGVVAAPAPAYPPTDVQLGSAGGGAPGGEPLPPAPQIALGEPGSTARRAAASADDVELGAPGARAARPTPVPAASDAFDGATEVSIDLADHIAVRPDDVKEAVRASKVMAAVDMPPGLFDSLEERAPVKPPTASRPPEPLRAPIKPATRPGPRSEPRIQALHVPSDSMPEARIEVTHEIPADPRIDTRVGKAPITKQSKAPVELPRQPGLTERSAAPPAPQARVSPVLLVILILAIVGAGGFVVWKYVLGSQEPDVEPRPPVAPAAVKPVAPSKPPPPPAPASKVVMAAPAPDDIKVGRAGQIETILADKTTVKAGDVIVKLVGDKPIEAEITGLTRDVKRIQDLIDAATRRRDAAQTAGNKAEDAKATAEIADRQKALTAKQGQLSTRTADLDKFLIQASTGGAFEPVAKPGQKVASDEVVARLVRDSLPSATFPVTDATPFATNASIEIAVGKGEQRVACTIADVQPDSVKVTCPADPAIAEGTDVTLRMPGTAPESPDAPKPAAPPLPR
jgi:hypothetical protein